MRNPSRILDMLRSAPPREAETGLRGRDERLFGLPQRDLGSEFNVLIREWFTDAHTDAHEDPDQPEERSREICQSCQYRTGSSYLWCAVHPSGPAANNSCADFAAQEARPSLPDSPRETEEITLRGRDARRFGAEPNSFCLPQEALDSGVDSLILEWFANADASDYRTFAYPILPSVPVSWPRSLADMVVDFDATFKSLNLTRRMMPLWESVEPGAILRDWLEPSTFFYMATGERQGERFFFCGPPFCLKP